jgi:hypothetical protein
MAHKNHKVACAAIDGVTLLVQDKQLFEIEQVSHISQLETYISVIDRICWSISEHISRDEKGSRREIAIVGNGF